MKRPVLIEFVGPPGVGKSTLARALAEAGPRIVLGQYPSVRQIRFAPFFVEQWLKMGPHFLSMASRTPGLLPTAREFAQMAILNGWDPRSTINGKAPTQAIVLETGPVHLMTTLLFWGRAAFRHPGISRWWNDIYALWGSSLSVVVSLDAEERDLIDRIRHRKIWHSVKERSDIDSLQYLMLYRSTIQAVLFRLTQQSMAPRILQFNTSTEAVDAIQASIQEEILRQAEELPRPIGSADVDRRVTPSMLLALDPSIIPSDQHQDEHT